MLLKIPTYKGKILLEVYNQQKKLINMNKLCINDEMVAIIKFSGLRFLKQKFIAEWEIYKIKLLKVIDEDNLPSGYFFSDDADANIKLQQPVQEESLEESNIFFNLEEDEQQINFINDNNINEKQLIETKEVKVEKTTNINNENDNDNEETSNQVQEELEKEPNNDDNEESNNQVREELKEELNNDNNDSNNDDDNDNDNEESNNQVQEELKEELNNDNNDNNNNNDDDNEEINNQSKEEIKDTNDDVIDNDEYNSNSEEDIDYEFTDSEYELDLDDELDELTLTNNFEHIKKETKKKLLLQEKEKKEEEMAKIQKELETMNN